MLMSRSSSSQLRSPMPKSCCNDLLEININTLLDQDIIKTLLLNGIDSFFGLLLNPVT